MHTDVTQTLLNHRSYHKYKDTPVPVEQLDTILRCAQAAPSWIHGQQVSMIVVKDQTRKGELARLAGGQQHVAEAPVFIVFCADFHRAHLTSQLAGQPFEAIRDVDVLLVGATDVGLAMAGAIASAESYGLGTLPIGGIRRSMQEVSDLLQLPEYVVPVAGLCLGYPDEQVEQKPRLPQALVVHEEQYQAAQSEDLEAYDEMYKDYLRQQGVPIHDWTKRVANFYAGSHYNGGYRGVAELLRRQGFPCEDIKD